MTKAEKQRRANLTAYKKRFDVISLIHDVGFKPKKKIQKFKGEVIREFYEFTPQQKARITRLSSQLNDEGIRQNSHLYNVARNVKEGNATFKKLRKTKNQKKQLKSLNKSGVFTSNEGFVIFSPGADEIKIKRRGKRYIIDYVIKPVPPKEKNVKRVASKSRHEIFIPIPLHIWQSEDLLAIFLADLQQEYSPFRTRLAINGRQGKTSFNPNEIYKYITVNLARNFVTDTPYVTGVYLIFKDKGRQL